MSEAMEGQGSCLCGATGFSAKKVSNSVGACHCGICRKWGGGPLIAVDCGTDITWRGEEHISVYDSSDWADRGFCKQCGSHLFYRLKANGQYIIPQGLLDGGEGFVFDHQVFIEEKPSLYAFANETKNMTGAELFAQFGAAPD